MPDQIQLRGGTAAENDAFTGAARELTVDTTNNTLRIHDGTTAGGQVLATLDNVNSQTLLSLADVDIGTPADGDRLQLVYDGATSSWQPLTFEYAVGGVGPAGGLIFFVDINNEHDFTYLESSTVDQSTGMTWSNNTTTNIPLTSMDLGEGARNTDVVIAGSSTSAALTASEYSSNGFTDWFLPSRDELNLMYTNLHCQGLGSFAALSRYWSSSQYTEANAWYHYFSHGAETNTSKSASYRVRACRLF
ncbi:MAG: DUF1566 domain-containing protein [Candidatus Saccharimonadales bacterium]